MAQYHVYIMTNRPSGTLYTGITRDIERRVHEHRRGRGSAFTRKYNVTRLVYLESCADVREAIAREKQIKGWKRVRKITLIESANPTWEDLLPPA